MCPSSTAVTVYSRFGRLSDLPEDIWNKFSTILLGKHIIKVCRLKEYYHINKQQSHYGC